MHSSPQQTPSLAANHRPAGPNEVWCAEMMRPDLAGRPLILLIVDVHTRHPLLAVPATSVEDIATTLDRLSRHSGRPKELRIDHALEFNPALRDWAHERGVRIVQGPPGAPQWKAVSEPIIRKLADHLSGKRFATLADLGHDLENWRQHRVAEFDPVPTSNQ
ncbi:transposase InsO family protein [Bradyrhizobium diazoefficiens]